jgi:hypothetical protein
MGEQNLTFETSATNSIAPIGMNPADGTFESVINEVCALNWTALTADDLTNVAWAYYYFSVQFCENVGIARDLFPGDKRLAELDAGERNTDNLSPYPSVAGPGEKLDHDEFMRRALMLTKIDDQRRARLKAIGSTYLEKIRGLDRMTRARSLSTYEDGGLERVFRAICTAPVWDTELLRAFHHFLVMHIALDSNPDTGHGSLCRHLAPTGNVVTLWRAFKDALVAAAPRLAQ